TGLDVLARSLGLCEQTGRLDHHVHSEVTPRQIRRVALRERLDGFAVHHQPLVTGADLTGELAQYAVVLQQVGHRVEIAEIVERDHLEIVAAVHRGAEEVAPDPAETIHTYANRHYWYSSSDSSGSGCHPTRFRTPPFREGAESIKRRSSHTIQ